MDTMGGIRNLFACMRVCGGEGRKGGINQKNGGKKIVGKARDQKHPADERGILGIEEVVERMNDLEVRVRQQEREQLREREREGEGILISLVNFAKMY